MSPPDRGVPDASDPMHPKHPERRGGIATFIGLAATGLLIAAAAILPRVFDWDVRARRSRVEDAVPPLHGYWDPQQLALGSLPAILIAVLAVVFGTRIADRLGWRRLLALAYAVGLVWMFSLALLDGPKGVSGVLGNPYEYLRAARDVTDVPATLAEFVSRIPMDASDNWVTHVAGHPPGALLFFVGLVRIGLGGDLAAGVVVTLIAATVPLAVLVTARALGFEAAGRRALPFLVLGPAAIFSAVSADAVFAAVTAWGLACLALAATAGSRARMIGWSVGAGLLLGYGVMMSYGLPLMGTVAIAVLLAGRGSWWPLPVAALAAVAVVVPFVAYGYYPWEAYPTLSERYWDGIASDRPGLYWTWANLAAFAVSAGPMVGAALAALLARRRQLDRGALLLVAGGLAAILIATLSQMSRSEVERIWLPFLPWVLLAVAALPARWRAPGLAVQVVFALAVEHLLYTSW